MSVFQNPHMAGRTGFGSSGGYRQPRGGVTRQDTFGDGVRQAIQQPSSMQMAPARQAFSAYSPSQNSQSMAPARQAFAAYAPQQPTAQPQAQTQREYASYSPPAAPQTPSSAPPSRMPSTAQNDAMGRIPMGANGTPGAAPSNGPLRPEFAALQGRPRPVQYINSPQPGAGNWMNDPNQRAAVGLGSGTIRPGELIM